MSNFSFLPASNIKKVNFDNTLKVRNFQLDNPIKQTTEDSTDINDEDPTDIKEEDEIDILNDTTIDLDVDIYLTNLMTTFLDKFPHLDNYKNKQIIYKLCKILVEEIPDQKPNPVFYINLLESTIKDITLPELDDLFEK